ncbi:hypothetical protein Hypma_003915 [Hypsizygus marmoreus]|uniref:Uncharacterized protein n=1 Tax=Hypsizygus marmoreus TaxID=39966 RepID=A0A369K1N6_HYPMA|nr:hypothetical protein Hypma_003915 [Hypsizygus marmoreus]
MTESTLSSLARGGVVPKLSRLMCETTGSLEPHVDMLERRTSMTHPASDIKDVVLIVDCREDEIEGMREAHHARVAKLREQGITVSLVCWGKEDVAGFAKGYRPA